MKRLIACIIIMLLMSDSCLGANSANIKIRIAGAIKENNYYLCMPDLGCLSIYAAMKKGKVYSILHPVEMNTLFITDLRTARIHNQGLPISCQVTVPQKKTITISGSLVNKNGKVNVNHLHCTVK